MSHPPKKIAYFEKLTSLCENHSKVLIVEADYVGSKQIAEIRHALRGKAIMLMGKNTLIRTALRLMLESMPQLEKLIGCVRCNIGLVFCSDDPAEVRKIILDNRVPAPAKQGVIAPISVVVPPGPTGLDPSQTSFFQALGITTKIVRGQVEIQNEVNLIAEGERVGASQAVLLQKLNIRPFTYGLAVRRIYDDGTVYDASALDITDEHILKDFGLAVQHIAAFSLELNVPNEVSLPHVLIAAVKNCIGLGLEVDYEFDEMLPVKKLLNDPEALAAMAAAAAGGGGGPAKTEAAEEKKVEAPAEEESEEEDMGFSLFD